MPNKTITQVPVVAKNIKRIVIEPATIDGDTVTWKLTYEYDPVDDLRGSIRVTHRVKAYTVGAAAQTTLRDFVTNGIVPDANTAEGT